MRSPEGLARRVFTAAALLGAFLATLLLLDSRVFATLLGAVLGLAAHEWARLAGFGQRAAIAWALGSAALYGLLAWNLPPSGAARDTVLGLGVVFWLLVAPSWLRAGVTRSPRFLLAVAGSGALAIAGLAAVSLSPAQLLLVLGLVWIADTAAYFAGNAFGRRRLAPTISPGKTWEGAAGALAATLAYAILCAMPGAPLAPYVHGAAWAGYVGAVALLCGVSIVGDLFESALKRRAGVKDSGTLLPGHGGILDRVDSLMPTLPIAALLLHWATRSA
ncbi:MAG: phosphatidate cytidylyltransferase [Betaproteobacteria bacterium]|nr:phosphatidate cytidylyltransferase [Betaproteobacteria bacterium]